MQKCVDFNKINVSYSWNNDLMRLETLFRGVIHMLQEH